MKIQSRVAARLFHIGRHQSRLSSATSMPRHIRLGQPVGDRPALDDDSRRWTSASGISTKPRSVIRGCGSSELRRSLLDSPS